MKSNSVGQDNINIYRDYRDNTLRISRELASELTGLSVDQIENIERGEKSIPSPQDIKNLAKGYKWPELKNYYCTNVCEIGTSTVQRITLDADNLPQIVLQILSSLNKVQDEQTRLIEITADGTITNDEMQDFVNIKNELEKISMTVNALNVWAEKKILDEEFNNTLYEQLKKDSSR